MKTVTYMAKIKGQFQEVTIIPSQVELVIRAMQRMSLRIGNSDFELNPVKEEIKRYESWLGECWLSDRAIRAVIKTCDDRRR